ncbi:hypothetical protein F5Y16DRAFT_52575 [Xylariaceae sp. FL0255]|nr:hypothetical protein F5Y16DRAFT_52575 [Xylariaceae sp. FL0255]
MFSICALSSALRNKSPILIRNFHNTAIMSGFPIILIGIHSELGAPIAQGLRKDGFDIIRQIQSVPAAKADLPHLLAGREPPNPPTNNVGSGEYGRPARAVLVGRGFTEAQVNELRELFDSDAAEPVLWAAGKDTEKAKVQATMGSKNDDMPPPGYEKIIENTMRGLLRSWVDRGAKEGELVLY